MDTSVFDIFKVGIGPSSSHTVGPMRAARRFATHLIRDGLARQTARVQVELFGSLGFTGKGHGSDRAIILGLEGDDPATVDVEQMAARVEAVTAAGTLRLASGDVVGFEPRTAIIFHRRENLPLHPNGMRFSAFAADGAALRQIIYYSVGGGFVVDHAGTPTEDSVAPRAAVPYPFASGAELLERCNDSGLSISTLVMANERARSPEVDPHAGA